jgi:hypothetical protein
MTNKHTAIVAALIACGAMHGAAQAQWMPDFKFSGFGTVGAVRTNTDEANFGRDRQSYGGANTNATLDVDSNLGLQATATVNSWLSGTVQVLTVKRQTENHLTTEAEWGFVRVQPLEGLTIRGGRLATPMFLVSDSRNVGYANNWLRAPNEVYGLVSFRRMQGFDVSYQRSMGSNTLTVTALSGTSATKFATTNIKMKGVKGLTAQLETDWGTYRVGKVEAKYDIAGTPTYSFTGIGMSIDRNNIFAQAEYVKRRAPKITFGGVSYADSDGWYVMAGYRLGAFLPYVMHGNTTPDQVVSYNITGTQTTNALGLRWDAFKSAAVKFQLERADTKGSKGVSFSGAVKSPVTVASASIDFVF